MNGPPLEKTGCAGCRDGLVENPEGKSILDSALLARMESQIERRGRLKESEALQLLTDPDLPLSGILALADRVRQAHSAGKIRLCAIVNARSGNCSENCAFCAQSAHHAATVDAYPLLDARALAAEAARAAAFGATEFSMVTSGPSPGARSAMEVLEQALGLIRAQAPLGRCASLGMLCRDDLLRLKAAGLQCLHHNLETSRRFFPEICTSHTYDDRLATVRLAVELGLRVCSGGIFGMGETPADRVALALELSRLNVRSVPLNFLHPIPGTPLENARCLTPHQCLRIIAMFRLVLPDRDIIVCGGREHNLRSLQPLIFWAGANGMMIGDYLTTAGRDVREDLEMLENLDLEPYEFDPQESQIAG